jgi:predicted nucleic acid-binding protein
VLYELLGRAAVARLLTLIWSDQLLAEAKRVLTERKPLTEPVADRWVGYLRDSFPDGRTDLAALPAGLDVSGLTSDPADEHVAALAIVGGARYLLTFDRGYLDEPLLAYGVTVMNPDDFLTATFEDDRDALMQILEQQAATWDGGRPLLDLVAALERARATQLATLARAALAP